MKPHCAPLAVVGMACRFPGIDGIPELIQALYSRFVAAGPVPADRWDRERYYSDSELSKGKTYIRRGNFLRQNVRTFDASFFGISPREAENMDPQQRLMLEVVWEAFENCGLLLPEYSGRNVGVYVGGFMLDHMITQMSLTNRSQINQHTAAGMMMTMLSNRVSHTFNFRGPSLSMDTACSSSLVAFHYACQDVWRGDCEMAIAGGVNVMMRPEYPIGMSKGHFLSRDGESKSFDSRGDGYGRGEGAGVVLIKPLEAAIRNGDPILATVVGTGTNQDGRTPGISMPSGEAQRALIEQVCRDYQIDPAQVNYVECHGTGTAIGDPTECRAIAETYGKNRSGNDRVVVGSIKSNIGHLEAAAGVAGVIKAILTIMHRKAFPLGNLQEPNAEIAFEQLGLRLSDDLISLGTPGEPLTVAVNSFGYGGSNAHAILQSPPSEVQPTTSLETITEESKAIHFPIALPLSARSKRSLLASAQRMAEFLKSTSHSLGDIAYTASLHRAHLTHRAVVLGQSREELIERLEALASGNDHEAIVQDVQPYQGLDQPVFVFTGMGPQWWGMGQMLYRDEPVYRRAVEYADQTFQSIAGWSILDEMLKTSEDSLIQKTIYAQPANFIVQLGILAMLEAAGVRPGAVVGHSVGELGSAYAAGVLSLEDALRVSYFRSQIQAEAAGEGGMLAAAISRADALRRIERFKDRVSIAANNSPDSVTLAGDFEPLQEIAKELEAEGIFHRQLEVEIPYHSPLMDPLMPRLQQALSDIVTHDPKLPVYSTVTGDLVAGASFGADYWPQNIRQPVEFAATVAKLLEAGYRTFVEIGPHPVLATSLKDCIRATDKDCRIIHTLRRNMPNESLCVKRAAMAVFAAGCRIDWMPHVKGHQRIALPNYAWSREHYWNENDRAAQDRINPFLYPLLGTQEAMAAPVWRVDFDFQQQAYLREHVVSGMPILPAAGYFEALLELASIQFPDAGAWALRNIEILRPLVLSADRGIDFTTSWDPALQRCVQRSLENGKLGVGQEHLAAQVSSIPKVDALSVDLPSLIASGKIKDDMAGFYSDLAQLGLAYGPLFQTIRELHHLDESRILARVSIDESLTEMLEKYVLHPTLLDGCFQSLMAMLESDGTTYLPTHVEEFVFFGERGSAIREFWCVGEMVERTARSMTCNLTLVDREGRVFATLRGLKATAANRGGQQRIDKYGDPVKRQILNYRWEYGEIPAEPRRLGHWLIVGEVDDVSSQLAARMESYGASIVGQVAYGTGTQASSSSFTIAGDSISDVERVLERCGDLDGVVFLNQLDRSLSENCHTGQASLNSLLVFTQAMLKRNANKRPRAYVVTQGAFCIDDFASVPIDPRAAAINGWVRVAASELSGFRFTTVDLDSVESEDTIEALTLELICDLPHDEVALRSGMRLTSELREVGVLSDDVVQPLHLNDRNVAIVRPLRPNHPSVGTVRVLAASKPTIDDDDLCVKIDQVLVPADLLAEAGNDLPLPAVVTVSGTILEKGSGVTDFAVGDRVVGLAPPEISSQITGPRDQFMLTRLPESADSAIVCANLAKLAAAIRAVQRHELKPGDRALLELNDLGRMVAMELVRRGVLVTFIAEELNNVPAEIKDNHQVCLACPESIERCTLESGRFDLLVADQTKWSNAFSYRLLRPGAGLIDLAEEARSLQNIPGHVGAISRTALESVLGDKPRLQAALADAVALISQNSQAFESPLEVSIADIAWKKLPLADAVSTLVLSWDTRGSDLPIVQRDEIHFRSDATWLITGGFGGFGQKTAIWLARQGVRHLVLTGRKGADTQDKQALVEQLRAMGVNVLAAACDTGNREQLARLFEEIKTTMPPLKGVYHSGAVILDQAIAETDLPTFNTVMQAKALGAWYLHELTQDMDLDQFVLYSSLSNQIGNSRQGAYCAANGYLNGLAWMRQQQGLPGISVNWGAISDVGVVAADEKLEQFLRNVGLRGLPSMEGLDLLRIAMARRVTQFGVVVIRSWADWARYETVGALSPRFAAVIAADAQAQDTTMKEQLLEELSAMPPSAQAELMTALIQQIVASVLKSEPETVSTDRPINELGIDSLMATEIQILFETRLGIAISVLELIGDITIRSLASNTLASLQAELANRSTTVSSTSVKPLPLSSVSDSIASNAEVSTS